MLLAVWIALAVGVLAVVLALVTAVVKGLRGWRTLKGLRRGLEEATGQVLAAAATAEQRAGELTERLEVLTQATERLEQSLAELRVLTSAAAEVRDTVARIQGVVPTK
jgi:hypothetical protein